MGKLERLVGFKNIFAIDSFGADYKALFKKSSRSYKVELKKLYENLRILDTEGVPASLQHQTRFEKLKNEDLYAIRHVSKLNPRVIFAHEVDGYIILLSSFLEKNPSDYALAISKAREAIKRLEGG